MATPQHVTRKLRMYIYHTHTNQPQQPTPPPGTANATPPTTICSISPSQQQSSSHSTPTTAPGALQDPPSWVLTIYGRAIDTRGSESVTDTHTNSVPGSSPQLQHSFTLNAAGTVTLTQPGTSLYPTIQPLDPGSSTWGGAPSAPAITATHTAATAGWRHPMTHYLRKVEIQLDAVMYPGEAGTVVWQRHTHLGPDVDSIQVRRLGKLPCKATVRVTMDWQPERYV